MNIATITVSSSGAKAVATINGTLTVKLVAGDTVTIANSNTAALNNAWTVRGTDADISAKTFSPPTTSSFEFAATQHGYTTDGVDSSSGMTGTATISATLNGEFKIKPGTTPTATQFVVDLTENAASRVIDDGSYGSLSGRVTTAHGDIYVAPLSAKVD